MSARAKRAAPGSSGGGGTSSSTLGGAGSGYGGSSSGVDTGERGGGDSSSGNPGLPPGLPPGFPTDVPGLARRTTLGVLPGVGIMRSRSGGSSGGGGGGGGGGAENGVTRTKSLQVRGGGGGAGKWRRVVRKGTPRMGGEYEKGRGRGLTANGWVCDIRAEKRDTAGERISGARGSVEAWDERVWTGMNSRRQQQEFSCFVSFFESPTIFAIDRARFCCAVLCLQGGLQAAASAAAGGVAGGVVAGEHGSPRMTNSELKRLTTMDSSVSFNSAYSGLGSGTSGGGVGLGRAIGASHAPITRQGYLYKKGKSGLKNWQKRWFVLEGSKLIW